MTTSIQTEIADFKADMLRIIEGWEKATGKRWRSDYQHVECCGHVIANCVSDATNRHEDYINAMCIAEARTITPLLAKMWLGQMEWLEERIQETGETLKFANVSHDCKVTLENHRDECTQRITSILVTWKGGKGG